MATVSNSSARTRYLNIIFHGLIVFIQRRDRDNKRSGIRVLIPNMGPNHAYLAGNWLGEIALAPGSYELRGVEPGEAKFDPERHTMLPETFQRPALTTHDCWVQMDVPQPHLIWSTRHVTLQAVDGRGNQFAMPAAHTHVFTFKASGHLHDIRLGEHPWAPDADHTSTFANLHVFASPESRPRVSHHVDEFHLANTLLYNVELRLAEAPPHLPPIPPRREFPALLRNMVARPELEDLASRNIRMTEMGRLVRQGKTPDIGSIWEVVDELSEPLACTTEGGDECPTRGSCD